MTIALDSSTNRLQDTQTNAATHQNTGALGFKKIQKIEKDEGPNLFVKAGSWLLNAPGLLMENAKKYRYEIGGAFLGFAAFVFVGSFLGGVGHGILGINLDPTMLAVAGGVYGAYKGNQIATEKKEKEKESELKNLGKYSDTAVKNQENKHKMERAALQQKMALTQIEKSGSKARQPEEMEMEEMEPTQD